MLAGLLTGVIMVHKGLRPVSVTAMASVSRIEGNRIPAAASTQATHDQQAADQSMVVPALPLALAQRMPSSVAQWIKDWNQRELAGKSANVGQIASLVNLLQDQPLQANDIAGLISTIANLDGSKVVEPLMQQAIDCAAIELKQLQTGDVTAKPVLAALWPLHDLLWDSQQYALDGKLLNLLLPWETRGSGHSQWARYLYAEDLYYQGKTSEAYDVFCDLLEERKTAFEPSEGVNRPLTFELGLTLFSMDKYVEAEPYLKSAAEEHKYGDTGDVLVTLVLSLVRQDKLDEARTYAKQFYDRKCVSVLEHR